MEVTTGRVSQIKTSAIRKIREQLSKMDPKDPEAKLLRKMLNLKKNR